MASFNPVKLVEFKRSGLIEQICSGIIEKMSFDGDIFKIGDDKGYPFFLRSSAKPMQASVMFDLGVDKFFDFSLEEIAICTSSHSGEERHVNLVKNILDKVGLDETYLKCGVDKPLSIKAQAELIKKCKNPTVLHNNCSGKHAMMLGICKKMGWSLCDYDEVSHPLQILIKKKIYELCEMTAEYPITKDGCGVPICSMPLENMIKGFFNVFFDDRYLKIREAFLAYPELISGEERLDNAIMNAEKNIIMKSGASGICVIVNLQSKEGLAVKMTDFDSNARAIVIIEALRQLGWLSEKELSNPLIMTQNNKDIFTLHNEKVGNADFLFHF